MLSQGVIDFCHVVWLSVTEELKRRCLNLIELGDWHRRRIISSSLKRFDSFVPTLSPSRVCPSMSLAPQRLRSVNGVNGMSDIEGSEPDWHQLRGKQRVSGATNEFQ